MATETAGPSTRADPSTDSDDRAMAAETADADGEAVTSETEHGGFIGPFELSPPPKAPQCQRQSSTSSRCGKTAIITASPYKATLEQASKQKKQSRSKKKEEVAKYGNKKKNKKATCRADKPRGRKPKNAEAPKVNRKRKSRPNENKKVQQNEDSDAECLICGECFSVSMPGEQWIQCMLCCGWCHYECTSGENSRRFVCEFCH